MLAKVRSCTVIGINGLPIEVEVDVALGLPVFATVGLPDGAVRESKERVKSAIKNCGYEFPARKITVNLAPADVRKEGTGFDLPIAIGILAATGHLGSQDISGYCVVGELSLDGKVRRVNGVLSMVLAARDAGMQAILIPVENSEEAAIAAAGIRVIPVEHLPQAIEFLAGSISLTPLKQRTANEIQQHRQLSVDFADVKGQDHVKRALEVAASGGHNILMKGPPGSGKTMLARRLATILPEMTFEEILETTKIYSIAGQQNGSSVQAVRPFRSPHHTISDAGLIGGGSSPRPGEVSMAHNGVLFLDELPEFKKHVLEVLRQPLEDESVTIVRANMALTFPARFVLVVAMNPCPCGFLGDTRNTCNCNSAQIQRYESRISGPLLDRIDMHLEVSAVPFQEMSSTVKRECSASIKERVDRTREVQKNRFSQCNSGNKAIFSNSQMGPQEIERFCDLNRDCLRLLERGVEKLGLSARAYNRILKIARTLADMENSESLSPAHIAEAIQFRRFDKKNNTV